MGARSSYPAICASPTKDLLGSLKPRYQREIAAGGAEMRGLGAELRGLVLAASLAARDGQADRGAGSDFRHKILHMRGQIGNPYIAVLVGTGMMQRVDQRGGEEAVAPPRCIKGYFLSVLACRRRRQHRPARRFVEPPDGCLRMIPSSRAMFSRSTPCRRSWRVP